MTHYSLRPETYERISAAQTAATPTPDSEIQTLVDCIKRADNWRLFCFMSGNLVLARTTAVMIGVKRGELRKMQRGM